MIKTADRVRIDYFRVDGTPGGSQDWFEDYWMHIGGCAALAACDLVLCLAGNLGYRDCLPNDPHKLTREAYLAFGMTMKPYIRPRPGGVIRLSTFTKGLTRYLEDCGYQAEFAVCKGGEDYVKACRFVKAVVSHNLPVVYLLLHHKEKRFQHLQWHWFVITGYEIKEGRMRVTYHTYGGVRSVDFFDLWHTGKRLKGGMVGLARLNKG